MRASSVIYMTNSLSLDYTIRGLINMNSISEQETKGRRTTKKNQSAVMIISWHVEDQRLRFRLSLRA